MHCCTFVTVKELKHWSMPEVFQPAWQQGKGGAEVHSYAVRHFSGFPGSFDTVSTALGCKQASEQRALRRNDMPYKPNR